MVELKFFFILDFDFWVLFGTGSRCVVHASFELNYVALAGLELGAFFLP